MDENRRPVSTRDVPFFQKLAKKLVGWGLTPNQVSVLSFIFALIGGLFLTQISSAEGVQFYLFVIVVFFGIQLRLICNLIDGLMAVEGGLKTSTGELYNDIPDRFSDLVLIMGAAGSLPLSWGLNLGWIAVVFAILTAYIRVLGASMQKGHDFSGPGAKQHRMFVLNLMLVLAVAEKNITGQITLSFAFGLSMIVFLSFITIFRRIGRLAEKLKT
jgi:phosphatidylglycerophosphate synthase